MSDHPADFRSFNERVEETAFAGRTTGVIADMQADISEIKSDVKSLLKTQHGFLAIIAASAFVVPVAATIIVRIFF